MKTALKKLTYSSLIAAMMLCLFTMSSVFFIRTIQKDQQNQTEQYLNEITIQSKNTILKQIHGDVQTLQSMATFIGLSDTISIEHLMPILEAENYKNGFYQMGFIDLLGNATLVDMQGHINSNLFVGDRDYFLRAAHGENVLSEAIIGRLGKGYINVYAVPIIQKNEIVGILCAIHSSETFGNIINTPIFDGEGFTHIIQDDGTYVIRSQHDKTDKTSLNVFDDLHMKSDVLLDVKQGLFDEKSGTMLFEKDGISYFGSYQPIGINGWHVVSFVPRSVISSYFDRVIFVSIIVIIAIIIVFLTLFAISHHDAQKIRKTIMEMAYFDSLTKLYNHSRFIMRASKTMHSANYAMVMLDIQNFKYINELFGYEEGDRILRHIASTLKESCANGELYFREANDVFGAMLLYDDPNVFYERLLELLCHISDFAFTNNQVYNMILNAGVALIQKDDDDLEVVINRAVIARKQIKNNHFNCYALYDAAMHEQIKKRNIIEHDMEQALLHGEFTVYLQPKVSLQTHEVVGAEALARWISKDFGLILPNDFIPIFEANGFITKLDMYIFEQTCLLQKRWLDEGKQIYPISVNQSRLLFYKESYFDDLEECLHRVNLHPKWIMLELTESLAMEDIVIIQRALQRLHKIGFKVSMDDFGSGYSSLNVLQDIQIDELKLDRAFLMGSGNIEQRQSIIRKIVELTKDLSIVTVAEGVESIDQAEFLSSIDCDIAQGYFFAKPMTIEKFEEMTFNK